ncbi:MAG: hypothetical protein EON54_19475 [Alcaligenaceae bacterium]|nr:MAG: hypothetical protein EON54_19475 [Alcaligenaceae bacterium]
MQPRKTFFKAAGVFGKMRRFMLDSQGPYWPDLALTADEVFWRIGLDSPAFNLAANMLSAPTAQDMDTFNEFRAKEKTCGAGECAYNLTAAGQNSAS